MMVSEGPNHLSQSPSHLAPRMDKEKQPTDDRQQKKRKRAVKADNKDVVEAREGSLMADKRRIEQRDR